MTRCPSCKRFIHHDLLGGFQTLRDAEERRRNRLLMEGRLQEAREVDFNIGEIDWMEQQMPCSRCTVAQ